MEFNLCSLFPKTNKFFFADKKKKKPCTIAFLAMVSWDVRKYLMHQES